jgi:E3 ubiquitin-protein ligase HUWE1
LNTTDVDILLSCLGLGWRLAQRYYTSRTRSSSSTTQATLLASHYNISLSKVATLASPFLKSIDATHASRDKNASSKTILPVYLTDLGQLARGENPPSSSGEKGKGKAGESNEGSWEDWGGAWISYYVNPKASKSPVAGGPTFPPEPTTPTPARRLSLHHHSHTHSGPHQHSPSSASRARLPEDPIAEASNPPVTGGLQTLDIPYTRIKESATLEDIVKSTVTGLPAESQHEFLHRLRVASALAGDIEARRKILAVRILALINLAYVYTEPQFLQKVLTLDQDEPRRLQLVYQLAELVQASDRSGKGVEVPRWLQTLALGGLEAFARHKSRTGDVCSALSINVNHGVLLYIVRKTVSELASEDEGEDVEADSWREALFSLLSFLPTTSHAASLLVSAGLIPILIDLINLRTKQSHRHLARGLSLVDQLFFGAPTAFQTFANAKGLEAVVDLASHETQCGLEEVETGDGILDIYRTEQTDYSISHYRQQTLKMVTKFIQHMMGQSGAGVDRLLRNLVDNPKLLDAIRVVVSQGHVWGSNIWSTVVSVISSFIHNEPTSYAVIHEAHITHAFLEAITGNSGLAEDEARRKREEETRQERQKEEEGLSTSQEGSTAPQSTVVVPSSSSQDIAMTETTQPEETLVRLPLPIATRIMPAQDAISSIPTALGAICLNPLGMDLIQASDALCAFFEIFESPPHVKILIEGELDNLLGTQFDELVRHHPNLRESIMNSTLHMLDRVSEVGRKYAAEYGVGAKVWLDDGHGGLVVSGGKGALVGPTATGLAPSQPTEDSSSNNSQPKKGNSGDDVEMSDADRVSSVVTMGETQSDGQPVGQVVTLADLPYEGEGDKNLLPVSDYIDVSARYLEGFITNTTQTRDFLRRGGLEKLLQFFRLPSLPYDFATSQANQTLCRTIHMCSDHNMAETLKAVFVSAQKAMDKLGPFLEHNQKESFFAPLTNRASNTAASLPPRLQDGPPEGDEQTVPSGEDAIQTGDFDAEAKKQAVEKVKANGTTLIKDLVTVHSLIYLLQDLYHEPMFNVRSSIPVFLQAAQEQDKEGLILKLGALQRQCIWEEIQLQRGIPADWDEVTRAKDSVPNAPATIESPQPSGSGDSSGESSEQKKEAQKAVVAKDGNTSWFRNVKTIRFLIGQIPTSINPFLQGKCLLLLRIGWYAYKARVCQIRDPAAQQRHAPQISRFQTR